MILDCLNQGYGVIASAEGVVLNGAYSSTQTSLNGSPKSS